MMRTSLASDPTNVRAARRFVERALANGDFADLSDLVMLLTSELVTNAFLHAATSVDLVVEFCDTCVRVEVTDTGSGEPSVRPLDTSTTGGRGMALLDTLANNWGVTPLGDGKIVWFELCH